MYTLLRVVLQRIVEAGKRLAKMLFDGEQDQHIGEATDRYEARMKYKEKVRRGTL